MPTLQIRLSQELFDKVKQQGGSPWARLAILDALDEKRKEPAKTAAPSGSAGAVVSDAAAAPALCPNWIHHRHGEVCKVCGELL